MMSALPLLQRIIPDAKTLYQVYVLTDAQYRFRYSLLENETTARFTILEERIHPQQPVSHKFLTQDGDFFLNKNDNDVPMHTWGFTRYQWNELLGIESAVLAWDRFSPTQFNSWQWHPNPGDYAASNIIQQTATPQSLAQDLITKQRGFPAWYRTFLKVAPVQTMDF